MRYRFLILMLISSILMMVSVSAVELSDSIEVASESMMGLIIFIVIGLFLVALTQLSFMLGYPALKYTTGVSNIIYSIYLANTYDLIFGSILILISFVILMVLMVWD